jgi:hypothetical protein
MTHLDDGADLRAVLDRSLRDLDAPDHVGPAAMASGRRSRTRRRAALTLTGVAAVAAVTALTLPALGGSGGARSSFADDPTPVPEPSVSDPTTVDDGWWSTPSSQMLRQLERTLPEGVTIKTSDTTLEGVEPGQDPEAVGGLWGTLSASTGPGAFQILLYAPELVEVSDGGSGSATSTPSMGVPSPGPTSDDAGDEHRTMTVSSASNTHRIKCRAYMDTCERIVDAAGQQIGRFTTDSESGTSYFELALLGPDGGALYFYVADSSGEKPGYESPSAEAPPLTPSQLRTLAEDPVWTSYVP